MSAARAVALVGDHLRHRWYASRLAADPRVELLGVISEQQPPQTRATLPSEEVLVEEHFALRREAEQRWFATVPDWEDLGVPFRAFARGETNTREAADWVQALQPDYLLLYGCGIIRAPLLEAYDRRTINIHLGLSPYYRGHATNFWPLVNGEPECVGATVHLATLDVDAGEILRQARPAMDAGDGSHDIGCKAIIAGADALLEALPRYTSGEITPAKQRPGGRVYRHADFDTAAGDAIAELRRRFAAGMIPDYLAHKSTRDARFPIFA
jgi:methionyl-tRNA formyltransferase